MPLSEVKTGMKGYGLTTFKGNTLSRFEVTVLGVIRKTNNGRDLIMIRMKGGPITERQANLIQGMSGSPIYINGRLIGGFSQGEAFSKEPVGMVTPIEDMLEAWDPKIPQKPSYFTPEELNPKGTKSTVWRPNNLPHSVTLAQPIEVGRRKIRRLLLNAKLHPTVGVAPDTAVLSRATSLLSVSNLKPRERDWLQKELDQKGYAITVLAGTGVGKSESPISPDLRPGSAFGAFFATGDVMVGSTGTVTYRLGNRMLGFGHPFFGMGALEAELTTASIVDIFSGVQVSHHIANAGKAIGTLVQDRDFSVAGVLGRKPRTVPFEVTVKDRTNGRTQTFRTQLFLHPDLTPTLMRLVARQAITQVHNVPGDVMAKIDTTVTADTMGTLTRSNVIYDPADPSTTATQDLTDMTNIASGNPVAPVPIRSGKMTIEIYGGRNTANVERIFVKQSKFEPGDNVEIGVQLKSPRRPAFIRTISLRIPPTTPTGRYQLIVRGGAPMVTRVGPFVISSGNSDPSTPPANIAQMVSRLKEQSVNTDLIARLILNSVAPVAEGEKLDQLPPHLSAFMRSEKNSGVRLEREEVKVRQSSEMVLTGAQQLLLNVVRKNNQDTSGGGRPGANAPAGGDSPTSGGGGSSLRLGSPSGIEEDAAEERGMENLSARLGQEKKPEKPNSASAPKPEIKTTQEVKPAPLAPTTPPAPAALAPPTKPVLPDKPIGKVAKAWRQTAREFALGKLTAASVTAGGDLCMSPSLAPLLATKENYLWALTTDSRGTLWAGTGNGGTLLEISKEGSPLRKISLPAVAVQSLIAGEDGSLYAGTGAPGLVYHVQRNGTTHLLGKVTERYVTALARDSQKRLYVGTGSSGTIYRVVPNGKLEAWVRTGSEYVTCLTTDKQDNLYVAAGSEGVVYKISPEGKSTIAYSTKEGAVTCITLDSKGRLYMGTGPRGTLLLLNSDGTTTTLFDKATSFFTALRLRDDNTLFAATANSLYRVTLKGEDAEGVKVLPLSLFREAELLSLALLPNGSAMVGTANVGELWSVRENTGGRYESAILDTRVAAHWGKVRWAGQGGQMSLETRSGDVPEPDGTWSAWAVVQREGEREGKIPSPTSRFLQYRITLSGDTAIRELNFSYLPQNQAPRVTFQSPQGGERWSGTQTLRWNAQDADGDALLYEVYYSADNGATWKPLPAGKTEVKTGTLSPTPTPSSDPVEELKKRLDATNMPATMKELLLERERQKVALKGTSATAIASKETSRALDTTALPDGYYLLKVVASDRSVNPVDGRTGTALSEAVLICNSLPSLSLNMKVLPDKSAVLSGSARQKWVGITAVQYRVAEGEWIPAIPQDGIFDSSEENFSAIISSLPAGKHVVELLVFNAAGGKSSAKMEIVIQ
jgi:sugar lactone lactonase YvrE